MKKILAMALVLCMVLAMVPATAMAEAVRLPAGNKSNTKYGIILYFRG